MAIVQRVYLLTGRPGTGKTSLIKQVVAGFKGRAGGFYTQEIREQGTRLGFKMVTLDGEEAVLAHVTLKSRFRVGKYGVDIESLERVGVRALIRAATESDLIIVDEIGKMELFSKKFRDAVSDIINSGRPVLGTIMMDSHPWADVIKSQPQVKIAEVTRNNHEQVLADLREWLKESNSQSRINGNKAYSYQQSAWEKGEED